MLKNDLKIVSRNLFRNKTYTIINILGLAIGITCVIFILLWVKNELSFDTFHVNHKNIFRIVVDESYHNCTSAMTMPPLAGALLEKLPEVKQTTRVQIDDEVIVKFQDKVFIENGIAFVDTSFFDIFSYNLILGSSQQALKDIQSVAISKRVAEKYFGETNPLGKTILIRTYVFTITGVFTNVPQNSHLQFDFVTRFDRRHNYERWKNDWDNQSLFTYVLLEKGTDLNKFEKEINKIIQEKYPEQKFLIHAQPLTKIYQTPGLIDEDFSIIGDIKYVYIFIFIAFIILIVASINFMNISVVLSTQRSREIGVKKVFGTKKIQLVLQFLIEAVLMVIIAILCSMILVETFLHAFNNLTGKELEIEYNSLYFWTGIIILTVSITFLAGFYPAFFLSNIKIVNVLKGKIVARNGREYFRKILTTIQFVITIVLVSGTIMTMQQMKFMLNKDIGFTKDNIIYIPFFSEFNKNYSSLKNELVKIPEIKSVSGIDEFTATYLNSTTTTFNYPGKPEGSKFSVSRKGVDYEYFKTMGIDVITGREFSSSFLSDKESAYIINEEFVKRGEIEHPIGKLLTLNGKQGAIVGVIKNVNYRSLKYSVEPEVYYLDSNIGHVLINLTFSNENRKQQLQSILNKIKRCWNTTLPDAPYEVHFMDKTYERIYTQEKRISKIFTLFASLAIIISCLGLFALTSFITERRTKEIGVRKVIGSKSVNIVFLLSQEFSRNILIAFIIACPVAHYAMTRWLQNFAYKTQVSWWVFVAAGAVAVAVALLTVSWQSWRAANRNPVEALRYE